MIDIFFTVINSAILLVVVWYAFIRFVLPSIHEDWEQQREISDRLTFRRNEAEETVGMLSRRIVEERALYADITTKVTRWREAVLARERGAAEERQRWKAAARMRGERQAEDRARRHLSAIVVPGALAKAQDSLEKIFQDPSKKQQYSTHVLEHLERSVS